MFPLTVASPDLVFNRLNLGANVDPESDSELERPTGETFKRPSRRCVSSARKLVYGELVKDNGDDDESYIPTAKKKRLMIGLGEESSSDSDAEEDGK